MANEPTYTASALLAQRRRLQGVVDGATSLSASLWLTRYLPIAAVTIDDVSEMLATLVVAPAPYAGATAGVGHARGTLTVVAAPNPSGPDGNDLLADAYVLTGTSGDVPAVLYHYTDEPDEWLFNEYKNTNNPGNTSNSDWWTWTCPTTGFYSFAVPNSLVEMEIFEGGPTMTALQLIAFSGGYGNTYVGPKCLIRGVAGRQYWVRLYRYTQSYVDARLVWAPLGASDPPVNDNLYASPQDIPDFDFGEEPDLDERWQDFTLANATLETDETGPGDRSIWWMQYYDNSTDPTNVRPFTFDVDNPNVTLTLWTYTPPAGGALGRPVDMAAVMAMTPVAQGQSVACMTSDSLILRVSATGAETGRLHYRRGTGGPPPAANNDPFAGAYPISLPTPQSTYTSLVDTTSYTVEPGEPPLPPAGP